MTAPTMKVIRAAQARVHAACLKMIDDRLIVGSAGNISERVGADHFVVSPAGVSYVDLAPTDFPLVCIADGSFCFGLAPTSEIALHRELYQQFAHVAAVVHTHSRFAAAFAVARVDLPFVCNENIGPSSERILVTGYGAPGTSTLGQQAVQTFQRQPGSNAVLLANHGVVAIGATVSKAYVTAAQVEWVAEVTHHASTLDRELRGVVVLPIDQQELIASNYGFSIARERATRKRSTAFTTSPASPKSVRTKRR